MRNTGNPCGSIYNRHILENKIFVNSCKYYLTRKVSCGQNLIEYE